MPITTVGSDRLIQCPKMVPQNHAHNTLILQVNLCATLLTEKAYFCGRMALWHQITRILSKPLPRAALQMGVVKAPVWLSPSPTPGVLHIGVVGAPVCN